MLHKHVNRSTTCHHTQSFRTQNTAVTFTQVQNCLWKNRQGPEFFFSSTLCETEKSSLRGNETHYAFKSTNKIIDELENCQNRIKESSLRWSEKCKKCVQDGRVRKQWKGGQKTTSKHSDPFLLIRTHFLGKRGMKMSSSRVRLVRITMVFNNS